MAKLGATGVVYHGMELLGGGAVLAGLMLGAIAAFIIDREFMKAAAYSLVAAVLSFFGFIHGAQLAWMASPMVAVGYVLLGAICLSVAMSEPTQKAGAKTESALA
jgi:adenine/guanine/hypoxanthine permease